MHYESNGQIPLKPQNQYNPNHTYFRAPGKILRLLLTCCLYVCLQFTSVSALLWISTALNTVDLNYSSFKAAGLCDDLVMNLHYLEQKGAYVF